MDFLEFVAAEFIPNLTFIQFFVSTKNKYLYNVTKHKIYSFYWETDDRIFKLHGHVHTKMWLTFGKNNFTLEKYNIIIPISIFL